MDVLKIIKERQPGQGNNEIFNTKINKNTQVYK